VNESKTRLQSGRTSELGGNVNYFMNRFERLGTFLALTRGGIRKACGSGVRLCYRQAAVL